MEHKPFFSFKSKLDISEYSQGYKIYDLTNGNSKGWKWKSSMFFFLALLMILILSVNEFRIERFPEIFIIFPVCVYLCIHYVCILPQKAKAEGKKIFDTSYLLSQESSFEFYKEYFTMSNQYEFLKRYYSEITDCIETDDIFLLGGGMQNAVIVISKSCIDEKKCSSVSRFFQNEMVTQYKRTKPLKKVKKQ